MRQLIPLIATLFLLFSCQNKSENNTVGINKTIEVKGPIVLPALNDCGYEVSENYGQGWQLIFSDEFVDGYEDDWSAWEGGAYNDELQHYQAKNVIVDQGFLYLCGRQESIQGTTLPNNKKPKDFDFTSGRLESKMLYGPKNIKGRKTIKFSARVKLVEGEGMWPAWWSYGDPWPTQGEIDILEARGHKPYEFSSCYHYGKKSSIPDTKPELNVYDFRYTEKLTDCFHVYEMEWSEDAIKILFDEELVKIYDVESYPYVADFWEKEHMLCLNLAIGGNFFESVDQSQIPDESFYVVDWVKVFQK